MVGPSQSQEPGPSRGSTSRRAGAQGVRLRSDPFPGALVGNGLEVKQLLLERRPIQDASMGGDGLPSAPYAGPPMYAFLTRIVYY